MRSMSRIRVPLIVLAVLALLPATAAGATAKAMYVGIVVSGHVSGCARWHSGITGDEILNYVAAVHYRRDGLIDQIDGQPSPPHADGTHYWSYWHDSASSWSYSGTGASSSTPAAGSVEGWSFVNGASSASPPARSPRGLYAALCGSRGPQPAPTPRKHHAASNPATRTIGVHAPATRASNGGAPRTVGRTVPRSTGTARHASPTTGGGTRPGASAASGSTGSSGPTIVDAKPASAEAQRPHSGSAYGVFLGIALAALLAAGAGWSVLRRRRAEAAEH